MPIMASDEEEVEEHVEPSRDDIRGMIREELSEFLADLKGGPPAPEEPGAPEETDEPLMSVRAIEQATKKAVREAMQELQARKPATPKKAVAKAPPEPTPEEPKKKGLAERLWG